MGFGRKITHFTQQIAHFTQQMSDFPSILILPHPTGNRYILRLLKIA